MPRLFVVVPFWNCEDLLGRCLASLEAQSHDATMVLIDDGSDAPARELARGWCEAKPNRVYLRRERNQGPAAARHEGLRWVLDHASTEHDVVVLLDGDDELAHPEVLERLHELYEADPRLGLTLGGHRRVSRRAVYRKRYRPWHLALRATRAVPWRARHPRTFRVGLLREVWPEIRWKWPNGNWLRSGTDIALVLPLLGAVRWSELAQLEEVLYVYHDVRPDGATLESSLKGRLWQLCTEAYVRRSLWWSAAALPRLGIAWAVGNLRRRARAARGRHG